MSDYSTWIHWAVIGAVLCGLVALIGRALLWAMAEDDAADLRRLEREAVNRGRHFWWTFCVLAADGQIPAPTRRITAAEWSGASEAIQRELSRSEQFEECARRG